jgi:hypothetical protein
MANTSVLSTIGSRQARPGLGGGLAGEDVRHIVAAMKGHPDLGMALLEALQAEAQSLLPGQRLLTFAEDEPE